jgi:hypothetical protein
METLSSELCMQLKKAGMKQSSDNLEHYAIKEGELAELCDCGPIFEASLRHTSLESHTSHLVIPTLSELIEELHKAKQFASLHFIENEWIASEWDDVDDCPRGKKGRGDTPEIAVASLYLAINQKKDEN